jgi:hypothetical protein
MGMMINRRRAYGGKKSLLPSGYKELEYIENTSNAYINTGVANKLDYSIKVKFKFNSFTNSNFVVCGSWAANNTSKTAYAPSYNSIRFLVGDTLLATITSDTSIHEVEYDRMSRLGYIDGVSTNNRATKNNNLNIYLFAQSGNAQMQNFHGNIYYVKIEGASLIREFIPCINPNNIVGMYDTVNGVFYSSPNGTAFIAGPDVTN